MMRAAALLLRTVAAAALAAVLGAACGDNLVGAPVDAARVREAGVDALASGTLFGEPCQQPDFPEIGACRADEGACHDEPGGSVCRPWCHIGGVPQCEGRGGIERLTDRGACVCVPP